MPEELPRTLERCDVPLPDTLVSNRSIAVVPETYDGVLPGKQRIDSRDQRARFLSWLSTVGKSPTEGEGYSGTV